MTEPVEVEFHLGSPAEVVEHMERLAHGGGWITVLPGVLPEDVPPPRSSLLGVFSAGSGHDVPEGTWIPPAKSGRPVQIGIRHNHGPRAAAHLGDRGHPLPPRWRRAMDHPKRGLVVEVPADTDHAEVLDWLLSATVLLTNVPLLEDWLAKIHVER